MESVTYNPLLPEVRRDPYPAYRALREADPVHRGPFMGAWVLTRYRDVASALRDDRMSADGTRASGYQELQEAPGPRSMLVVDPPYHTRLRTLVSKAFTPRAVERLRSRETRGGAVIHVLPNVSCQSGSGEAATLPFPSSASVREQNRSVSFIWGAGRAQSSYLNDIVSLIYLGSGQAKWEDRLAFCLSIGGGTGAVEKM